MTENNAEPQLVITGSRLFTSWLGNIRASLVFTTYQAGKIMFIGLQPDGNISVHERTFERCMGLSVAGSRIWMSSRNQIWRFENFLEPGTSRNDYDAEFVPVAGYTTGDVDIHDVHTGKDGKPVFVVTRFNSIATLAERGSFKILWKPKFIDKIAAEDRCHLNGLAMLDGDLKYATCVSNSNISEGWREKREGGGMVIDIPSDEAVCTGLSMPHSPRIYRDKLWLIQSGTGEFGYVDTKAGKFEPVCFLPGFPRGLALYDKYAIIGTSIPRDNSSFEDLAFNTRLQKEGVTAACSLCVVNIETGDMEHQLTLKGVVQELYDVNVLPDIIRPMALGFKKDDINFAIKPEIALING